MYFIEERQKRTRIRALPYHVTLSVQKRALSLRLKLSPMRRSKLLNLHANAIPEKIMADR